MRFGSSLVFMFDRIGRIADESGTSRTPWRRCWRFLNVEIAQIPLFSGGLHHGVVVDLDLVARLRVGSIQLPLLFIRHIGDGEDPYISLGPKNGQKITLPGSKSSSLGGYFHY